MKHFTNYVAATGLLLLVAAGQAFASAHSKAPVLERYMATIQAMPDGPQKAVLFDQALSIQQQVEICKSDEGHSSELETGLTVAITDLEKAMQAAGLETGNYSALAAEEQNAYMF